MIFPITPIVQGIIISYLNYIQNNRYECKRKFPIVEFNIELISLIIIYSIVYFGLISFTIFIIGYIFRFKGMSIIAEYIISFKLCISCNTKVFIVVFMFMTMIYLLSKNVYSGMIYFVLFYNCYSCINKILSIFNISSNSTFNVCISDIKNSIINIVGTASYAINENIAVSSNTINFFYYWCPCGSSTPMIVEIFILWSFIVLLIYISNILGKDKMKCIFFKILRFVFTLLFAGYIYAKLKNNSMQYYIYIKIFVFIVFSIIFHILFNYAYYKDIKKVFNDWQI